MPIARVRREYRRSELTERVAPADPLVLFRRWMKAALAAGLHEPTAMTLATADARGRPSARLVLLKGCDERGFAFFTNYASRKARELEANPHGALALWWPSLEKQVRVTGRVRRVSEAESDAYFTLRPRGAQLGAWASPQSRVIPDRGALRRRLARFAARWEGREIPRPPHWGGFRLVPRVIEFWQGRPDRLHDRLRFTRRGTAWRRERLAP